MFSKMGEDKDTKSASWSPGLHEWAHFEHEEGWREGSPLDRGLHFSGGRGEQGVGGDGVRTLIFVPTSP